MSGKTLKVNMEISRETADLIQQLWKRNPWMAYESLEEFFLEAGRRYVQDLLKVSD